MECLNLEELYLLCKKIKAKNEDLKDYIIYLGDDEELNGIHNGFYITDLTDKCLEKEEKDFLIDMINSRYGNIEFKKDTKAILIS